MYLLLSCGRNCLIIKELANARALNLDIHLSLNICSSLDIANACMVLLHAIQGRSANYSICCYLIQLALPFDLPRNSILAPATADAAPRIRYQIVGSVNSPVIVSIYKIIEILRPIRALSNLSGKIDSSDSIGSLMIIFTLFMAIFTGITTYL